MKCFHAVLIAIAVWTPLPAVAEMSAEASGATVVEADPQLAERTGTVLEAMDASRYTYLLLDTGTEKIWAAANQFAVKVGDTITLRGLLPMDGFHSESLDRTFDRIYFVTSVHGSATDLPPGHPDISGYVGETDVEGMAMPPGHPEVPGYTPAASAAPIELPPGHPEVPGYPPPAPASTAGGPEGAEPEKIDLVERAEGGVTVAEVYADRASLAGQTVAVRGKVVKVNNDILGRNWIHLQDGSGEDGARALTVTSDQRAAVGDTVVARGVLGTDRDFGAGYFYEVLLEDAALEVE